MDTSTTKDSPGNEVTDPQQFAGQKRDVGAIEIPSLRGPSTHSGRDDLEIGRNNGEMGEAKRPKLGGDTTTSLERNDRRTNVEGRQCFVTVGATAGFRPLLSEVLNPEFLNCLADNNFELLKVQCGEDFEWFDAQVRSLDPSPPLRIQRFAFTENMTKHYVRSRGEKAVRPPGVVVAHAGSGTILEVLRLQVPLVVVPNPTLMDNHQAELAEELESTGDAVYGRLGKLTEAITRSLELVAQDELRKQQHLQDLKDAEKRFQQELEQASAGAPHIDTLQDGRQRDLD